MGEEGSPRRVTCSILSIDHTDMFYRVCAVCERTISSPTFICHLCSFSSFSFFCRCLLPQTHSSCNSPFETNATKHQIVPSLVTTCLYFGLIVSILMFPFFIIVICNRTSFSKVIVFFFFFANSAAYTCSRIEICFD